MSHGVINLGRSHLYLDEYPGRMFGAGFLKPIRTNVKEASISLSTKTFPDRGYSANCETGVAKEFGDDRQLC